MGKIERQAKYREKLKQRMLADPVFAEAQREMARARSARWRAENPEKVRIGNSYEVARNRIVASRKRHADTRRANDATRRARKMASSGSYTASDVADLLKLQRGRCAMCGSGFGSGYQIDHVMPLALGGSNDRSNLQLLCRHCNQSKGARHPVDFAQMRGQLL